MEGGRALNHHADLAPRRSGSGGVEQIRSHGSQRVHAEEQYQQWRHKGATTHACKADDCAYNKAGKGIEPVYASRQ
jgi:hypothetical protein